MCDRRMATGAWECYSSLSRCHFRRPLETQIMTAARGRQRGDKGGNAGASQVGQDQIGHKVYRPVIGRPHFSHESHTTHLMQFICSMAHSVWLVVYIFIMNLSHARTPQFKIPCIVSHLSDLFFFSLFPTETLQRFYFRFNSVRLL